MGKTVAEKIFDAHHVDNPPDDIYVLHLDAVFCYEISTAVAINDLMARGKDRVCHIEAESFSEEIPFMLPDFHYTLVAAGGWLELADSRY